MLFKVNMSAPITPHGLPRMSWWTFFFLLVGFSENQACCCNAFGITIHLPFINTPSITAMTSLNVQYVLMSCGSWFLLSGDPLWHSMRCWRCWSGDVASCSSCIVMHSGMLEVDCIALILICMPVISSSLFSQWFCLDNQSAMKRSGPGLYMILTLYWCIPSRICCSLCVNVTTSFFFENGSEWFVMHDNTYLSHKAIMMEFFKAT